MNSARKRRLRYLEDGVSALSLATLFFIQSLYGCLYSDEFGYFSKEPVNSNVLLALFCNLVGFAAIFWVMAQVLRRHRIWWLDLLACLLLFVTLLAPMEFFRGHFGWRDRQTLLFIRSPIGLSIIALALGAALWRPRWVVRTATSFILLLSPLSFYALAKILLVVVKIEFFQQQEVAETPPPPPLQTNALPTRVVWIIFDELDQRLAFSERPAGLKLPEFDRLCSESIHATNAYSPGGYTTVAMPGLFTGQIFDSAKPCSRSDLSLCIAPGKPHVRFSELTNVFAAVRAIGGNTAAVGWYHPYSRLLQGSLNFVSWDAMAIWQVRYQHTFGGALIDQWGHTIHSIYWRLWHHYYAERAISESMKPVADPAYSLTLLHLPFPHSPAIYEPETQQIVPYAGLFPKGYFKNLQLTDRVLGQLRQAMERSGQWDKSWVLVSSDHNWRESANYDGRKDRRIPFILKPPGHADPVCYGQLLNTVVTKDLILDILQGKIRDIQSAATWLQARPGVIPDYKSGPTAD